MAGLDPAIVTRRRSVTDPHDGRVKPAIPIKEKWAVR
jgi:hypothetical protein